MVYINVVIRTFIHIFIRILFVVSHPRVQQITFKILLIKQFGKHNMSKKHIFNVEQIHLMSIKQLTLKKQLL